MAILGGTSYEASTNGMDLLFDEPVSFQTHDTALKVCRRVCTSDRLHRD